MTVPPAPAPTLAVFSVLSCSALPWAVATSPQCNTPAPSSSVRNLSSSPKQPIIIPLCQPHPNRQSQLATDMLLPHTCSLTHLQPYPPAVALFPHPHNHNPSPLIITPNHDPPSPTHSLPGGPSFENWVVPTKPGWCRFMSSLPHPPQVSLQAEPPRACWCWR